MRVTDLGSILSIWAHPDDETYLAGATMAGAVDAGQRVTCVSLTAGERGTDEPDLWPPDRLGRLRRWEAAAAMAVLGVTDHRVLDLPDGGLTALGDDAGVAVVASLVDELRPDTVLTFGPDGMTFHPDHIAVGRWATAAAVGRARVLHATTTVEHTARFGSLYEEWGVYMTDERPTPVPSAELAIDLVASGAELDRKLAALAAMASQTEAARLGLGPARYAEMAADEAFVAV
jgi:LmbE family N-acetylglucosaminyl deacetylase